MKKELQSFVHQELTLKLLIYLTLLQKKSKKRRKEVLVVEVAVVEVVMMMTTLHKSNNNNLKFPIYKVHGNVTAALPTMRIRYVVRNALDGKRLQRGTILLLLLLKRKRATTRKRRR